MSKKKQPSQSRPSSSKAKLTPTRPASSKNNSWLWIAAAVIILAVVFGGIYVLQSRSQSAGASQTARSLPDEISVSDAYQKYQAGTFFLDVRTPEEWNEYHAPNTTLIPLNELSERVNELPKDQEIVVVCRSGNRSQEGRDILKKAGFSQVTSMAGGLKEWKAAGYPTVTGP